MSKEASSTDFREEMHNLRYIILLGLPNGTSAIQEMDQGYGPFKRETDKSTIRFASRKMVERVVDLVCTGDRKSVVYRLDLDI